MCATSNVYESWEGLGVKGGARTQFGQDLKGKHRGAVAELRGEKGNKATFSLPHISNTASITISKTN